MTAAADLDEATARLIALAEQVGLRVLVVPADEPPMRFGTSVRTDLGVTAAGCADHDVDRDGGRHRGRRGRAARGGDRRGIGRRAGVHRVRRHHHRRAWAHLHRLDHPEPAERAMARNRAHTEARERFLRGPLGRRGFTSIWVPARLNPQHVRCPSCGDRHAIRPGEGMGRCRCGADTACVAATSDASCETLPPRRGAP